MRAVERKVIKATVKEWFGEVDKTDGGEIDEQQ